MSIERLENVYIVISGEDVPDMRSAARVIAIEGYSDVKNISSCSTELLYEKLPKNTSIGEHFIHRVMKSSVSESVVILYGVTKQEEIKHLLEMVDPRDVFHIRINTTETIRKPGQRAVETPLSDTVYFTWGMTNLSSVGDRIRTATKCFIDGRFKHLEPTAKVIKLKIKE